MSEKLNLVFDKKAIYWIKGEDLAAIVTAINQNRVTVPENQTELSLTAHGEDGMIIKIGGWKSFTDCEGNTFEIPVRNYKPASE